MGDFRGRTKPEQEILEEMKRASRKSNIALGIAIASFIIAIISLVVAIFC